MGGMEILVECLLLGETTSIKAKKLIQITYKCMMEGIKKIKPGHKS